MCASMHTCTYIPNSHQCIYGTPKNLSKCSRKPALDRSQKVLALKLAPEEREANLITEGDTRAKDLHDNALVLDADASVDTQTKLDLAIVVPVFISSDACVHARVAANAGTSVGAAGRMVAVQVVVLILVAPVEDRSVWYSDFGWIAQLTRHQLRLLRWEWRRECRCC